MASENRNTRRRGIQGGHDGLTVMKKLESKTFGYKRSREGERADLSGGVDLLIKGKKRLHAWVPNPGCRGRKERTLWW